MVETFVNPQEMKWATALSTRPSLEAAVNEVVDTAQARLGTSADIGFLFISATFASEYPRLLPLLKERLNLPALIGCGGGGIIGNPVAMVPGAEVPIHEIEDEPALCLCLGHLPGIAVKTFWLDEERLPDLDSPPQDWVDYIGVDPASQPDFVLIADPVTSKIKDLLQGFDFAYPTAVKVGGLASGGGGQRSNGLFCDDHYYEEGSVGVALSGPVQIKSVVAQGCRPVGPIFRVVEGQRNVILDIEPEVDEVGSDRGHKNTPLECLQELLQELTEEERELAQHSLFVGVAHSAFRFELGQGDFLIRNLVGIDPRGGAVAIGDRVRSGQRIQFHLRDGDTSTADLTDLLERYREAQSEQPVGALMFSCLGRGEDLYDRPHHDSSLFRRFLGDVPVSGFFCAGEIGPIGGSTYLHGYTAVFGIIAPA